MDDDDIGGSGYSIDDLSAYLDSGRIPRNADIERNAECRSVLASLEQVGRLSRQLVEHESRTRTASSPAPAGWLEQIMLTISAEVRAGRDIAYPSADARTTLAITEGAVRSMIRAAGDEVPGVFVSSSALAGDLESPGAVISVTVSISVLYGRSLPESSDSVRASVGNALSRHTPLTIGSIDVIVDDVRESSEGEAR